MSTSTHIVAAWLNVIPISYKVKPLPRETLEATTLIRQTVRNNAAICNPSAIDIENVAEGRRLTSEPVLWISRPYREFYFYATTTLI